MKTQLNIRRSLLSVFIVLSAIIIQFRSASAQDLNSLPTHFTTIKQINAGVLNDLGRFY